MELEKLEDVAVTPGDDSHPCAELPQAELGELPEQTDDSPSEPEAAPVESSSPASESVDIAAMIAEAEQRGYLRGVNEQLSAQMNRPALYANLSRTDAETPSTVPGTSSNLTSGFLANLRPSVWD